MRYKKREEVKSRIQYDIQKLNEYKEVDHFVSAHFQQSCILGEYRDNSLELSHFYKIIKEIESDSRFMIKLDFVLSKYVNYPLGNAIKEVKLAVTRDKKVLDNVINTLEKHNEWRRERNFPSKLKMVSPKELGEAIDKAIEILKTLK